MKKIKVKYVLFLLVLIVLISVVTYRNTRLYDYEFPVFEGELHVFTRKQWGGKFLVMFAKDAESLKRGYGVDSVETTTRAYIWIGFDKMNKDEIAIEILQPVKLNANKYKITIVGKDDDEGSERLKFRFFDENYNLREQYMVMTIDASSYYVWFDGEVLHQSYVGR